MSATYQTAFGAVVDTGRRPAKFPELMVIGSSMRSEFCLGVVIWKLARSSVVCTVGGVFFFLVMRFNGFKDILVSRLGECEWSWLVVAGASVRARVAGAERRTVTS